MYRFNASFRVNHTMTIHDQETNIYYLRRNPILTITHSLGCLSWCVALMCIQKFHTPFHGGVAHHVRTLRSRRFHGRTPLRQREREGRRRLLQGRRHLAVLRAAAAGALPPSRLHQNELAQLLANQVAVVNIHCRFGSGVGIGVG